VSRLQDELPEGGDFDAESAVPTALRQSAESKPLPVFPIRDAVLFPLSVAPLLIGREGSDLVQSAMGNDRLIVVVAQRGEAEHPSREDLYPVGTLAQIARLMHVSNDGVQLIVRGRARARLATLEPVEPYFRGRVRMLEDVESTDVETSGLVKAVQDEFARVVELSEELPDQLEMIARNLHPAGAVVDFIATVLDLSVAEKQELLEQLDVKQRLKSVANRLSQKLEVLEMGRKIREQMRGSMNEEQRQFMLRQQLRAIQKELGDSNDTEREAEELKARLEQAQLPESARTEADRELRRLNTIPTQSPEHNVTRTYLEWLADMPWAISTEDNLDLLHARAVLDEDHEGLEKVKDRLLEYLAVRRYRVDAKSPILCFVGPPGTGKTSLGRSIARALGRKFIHQSLGGVRDEAEIRGHRRTYVGALPGSIVQSIRRSGSNNPLFVLDEIDKLGSDFRGDPASALLEVLDPEQNSSFVDHYLDVPFDLSRVLFICTANLLDPVPPALRDRMEVITLSGYTEREKLSIARRHLLPRAITDNGLAALGLEFDDDAVLRVIREYTSEAGLRGLQRELETVLRRTVRAIAEGKDPPRAIGEARIGELLGVAPRSFERARSPDTPGAVLGLAWTPDGGEVLTIEALAMPGRSNLLLTGKLGDVMKESAQAALSYVRSHARELGVREKVFAHTDVHIHVPAGGIPKDGPSAGVAMAAALVSLFSGRLALERTAMTGEITLSGRVLPVGGIKEKVLAAHREGLTRVVLPASNVKDLDDVPLDVRRNLELIAVEHLAEVFTKVLHAEARRSNGAEHEVASDASAPRTSQSTAHS
jgi:ATP-dependent Lon protease